MEVAGWQETKWLVVSSCFFLVPASYAYVLGLFPFSILLTCTSLISANYWRRATHSWRRYLDLVFAKISFTVFVIAGVYYVRYVPYVLYGYSLLIILVYCYYLSGKYLEEKNPIWLKFHFMFHLLMAYEQFIILDSMSNTINKNELK